MSIFFFLQQIQSLIFCGVCFLGFFPYDLQINRKEVGHKHYNKLQMFLEVLPKEPKSQK